MDINLNGNTITNAYFDDIPMSSLMSPANVDPSVISAAAPGNVVNGPNGLVQLDGSGDLSLSGGASFGSDSFVIDGTDGTFTATTAQGFAQIFDDGYTVGYRANNETGPNSIITFNAIGYEWDTGLISSEDGLPNFHIEIAGGSPSWTFCPDGSWQFPNGVSADGSGNVSAPSFSGDEHRS